VRKLAIAVPIVAGIAAVAYLVIGAVSSLLDNDKYGKVPVPGEAALQLEEGTVAVYYQEQANLPENDSLDAPRGLVVRVALRGEPIPLKDKRFGSSYEIGSTAGTQVATLEAPESGTYGVVTSGGRGVRPEVTFGKDVPLGTLLLRSGLIILGGLAAGGLLWALASRQRRARPVSTAAPLAPPPQPAPAPPAPAAAGATATPEEELRRLEARHRAGELSEADYAAARRRILDRI
jgi:hypothetical protein